jgi:tRNA modification GTPase
VKHSEHHAIVRAGDWLVINKTDLVEPATVAAIQAETAALGLHVVALSAREEGADPIRAALTDHVIKALSGAEFPAATRIRHAERLGEARGFLERALAEVEDVELAAEDVRLASRALSRITGRIDPEDVLDRVFSSFCIGK